MEGEDEILPTDEFLIIQLGDTCQRLGSIPVDQEREERKLAA